ncbi:hypothetical protein Gohar_027880 [Gossypium harknessii]|uniref:Uncharacterized protein n=1 Tax=Gossypium harknessii TaxID=34285 RepID=A0A7J9IB68_9ROSI|nr:hypothetical protein [Gossypium harknessii]
MRLTKGTVMTRALVELSSEFESIKYGMVTATKSSIKEMLKGVKVEAGDEQDNMICLKELEAGFEAFQMRCSHVFHVQTVMCEAPRLAEGILRCLSIKVRNGEMEEWVDG